MIVPAVLIQKLDGLDLAMRQYSGCISLKAWRQILQAFSATVGVLTALAAGTLLTGWAADAEAWKPLGLVDTLPATASQLLLLGLATALSGRSGRRGWAMAAGLAGLAIGIASLAGWLPAEIPSDPSLSSSPYAGRILDLVSLITLHLGVAVVLASCGRVGCAVLACCLAATSLALSGTMLGYHLLHMAGILPVGIFSFMPIKPVLIALPLLCVAVIAGIAARTPKASSSPESRRQRRVSLFYGLFFGLPMVAIWVLMTWNEYQVRYRGTVSEAAALVRVLEEHAMRALDPALLVIRQISDAASEQGIDAVATSERRWMDFRRIDESLPQVDSFGILDRDGNLKFLSREFPAPQVNAADHENFKVLRDHPEREFGIGGSFRSKTTGKTVFTVARPLRDEDGKFSGVVFATMEIGYFRSFYQGLAPIPGTFLGLYRDDGVLLAREPMSDQELGASIQGGRIMACAAFMSRGTLCNVSRFDGVERVSAFARQGPFILAAGIPVAHVVEPWLDMARRTTLFLTTLALAVSGLIVLSWRSIDAAERSRAAQRESDGRLQTILEAIAAVVFLKDAAGRFLYVNRKWEEATGVSRRDAVGRTVRDLLPPEIAERFEAADRELMRKGIQIWKEDTVALPGGERTYLFSRVPLRDAAGAVYAMCGTATDITGRILAERALSEAKEAAEAASRAKSEFLANMSHEIRTPMNAILGLTGLLLRSPVEGKPRRHLEQIENAASSLMTIISDILDFSKIEAGRLALESTDFRLGDVLRRVRDIVILRAREKGLGLLFLPSPDLPGVLVGDPVRLGQVLLNLVGNALKFSERGEVALTIDVEERRNDGVTLRFSVRDTGIGMSEEEIGRLFTPFTQTDSSTTRRFGGTGLGLSICRRLVEMMDGSISVVSKPGRGSAFFFTAAFGLPESPCGEIRPPAEALSGKRILVADDNPLFLQCIARLLSRLGVGTDTAGSWDEAVDMAGRSAFDLALVEWDMAGLRGPDELRLLKRRAGPEHRPLVCLMSMRDRDEVLAEAAGGEVDGFLAKPVDASSLCDTVMTAFGGGMRPRAGRRPVSRTGSELAGTRVLLVEDNDINREVASEILAEAGVTVDEAVNGREAVDMLAKGPLPSAVLMDIQMPVLDGYEATRLIRGELGLKDLPILAMTAHAMLSERQRCLKAGMNDHVAKPINPDLLIDTLRRWVRPAAGSAGASSFPPEEDNSLLLPSIPGMDAKEGLRRTNGSKRLLVRMLGLFAELYEDAPERLRRLLAEGETTEAGALAHSIKGAAGAIGAREIESRAAALEHALTGGRESEAAGLLPGFGSVLSSLVRSIDDSLPKSPEDGLSRAGGDAGSDAAPSGGGDLKELYLDVAYLLSHNNMSARKKFVELGKAMPPCHGELVRKIEADLAHLDFRAAGDKLAGLATACGASAEGGKR